jgi:hypothetical protein
MADAEAGRDRDRRQQMCRVEQADIELVADVRPRHFAHQRDVEALGRSKSLVDGHNQRGRIGEWNKADVKRCTHFKSSDAVRIDCAMSPIFFFSRIAVERIST